ncbi:MAG: hypothetical protein R3F30_03180 [Planctomycetota bacterium]
MRAFLPLLALTIPAALSAQTNSFALPKGADKVQTKVYDSILGSAATNMPAHVQAGYATSEMTTAAAKVLSVNLRRNNYYGNQIYASSTDLMLEMSTNATDVNSWSTTFASNHGTNKVQVFGSGGNTKTLNWPADPHRQQRPAAGALQPQDPLDTPFVLIQSSGKSICIDFSMSKRTHKTTSGSETWIIIDADGQATGNRVTNGGSWSNCKFSDGKCNSGLELRPAA